MKILSCGKGDIKIQLDSKFAYITIRATGEMMKDFKGFAFTVSSIKQIEPEKRLLTFDEKKEIANALINWQSPTISLEIWEE